MRLLKTIVRRLHASFVHKPLAEYVPRGFLYLSLHTAASLSIALGTKFVKWEHPPRLATCVEYAIKAFFFPSLTEELIFRGALLPHREVDGSEAFEAIPRTLYTIASVGAFVLYHLSPFHKPKQVFSDWRFLTLAGLLGTTCSVVYMDSGSIWLPTGVHYLTVFVWVLFLGGYNNLHPS